MWSYYGMGVSSLSKGVGLWGLSPFSKNISVISWLSVLLVEVTEIPGENHLPAASHLQTLSHNVVSSTPAP